MERDLYNTVLPPDERLPTSPEKAAMTPEEYEAALAEVYNLRKEEVRKAIETMESETKTIERLVRTIADATMENSSAELLEVLADAGEWVLELDYAEHFGAFGEIHKTVALVAGHADPEVRTAAVYVVGSAIKGREDLQSMALEAGLVEAVRARFKENEKLCSISAPGKPRECGMMLYALSSLVRGHVPSQARLIKHEVLSDLEELMFDTNIDPRNVIKIAALVHDSFTEWPVCPPEWNDIEKSLSPSLCETLTYPAARLLAGAYSQYPQHLQRAVQMMLRKALIAAECKPPVRLPASFFLANVCESND